MARCGACSREVGDTGDRCVECGPAGVRELDAFGIHARVRHAGSGWLGTIIDYRVGVFVMVAWDQVVPNCDRWFDVGDLELVPAASDPMR